MTGVKLYQYLSTTKTPHTFEWQEWQVILKQQHAAEMQNALQNATPYTPPKAFVGISIGHNPF